jgi:hypothetical protein
MVSSELFPFLFSFFCHGTMAIEPDLFTTLLIALGLAPLTGWAGLLPHGRDPDRDLPSFPSLA